MRSIAKRVFLLVAIFCVCFIIGTLQKSNAMKVGDNSYLQRAEKGFYSIQRWNGSEWIYVTYSITNYIDECGVERVAYCVNPDLKGIGYISGEVEGYSVEVKELLSNQKVWRVIINGYPYKSPDQMGVENNQDAYLATKMAVYAMLRNNTSDDIRALYRAGEDRVAGEVLDEIQRRGNKVISAICNLVDIGNNGNETMQNNNMLSIEKVGELKPDSSNKNYFAQTMKVKSKVECNEYKVTKVSDFPYGTKVTDINGVEQNSFKGGDEFKIMVPKSSLIEDIHGVVEISGSCKNYPVYYAECTDGNYQNYLLCCDKYSNGIDYVGTVDIKISKSKLKISKIDKDKKTPLQGVTFSIKYMDGDKIGTYTTNEKGFIYLDNLHQGRILIKELTTADNYVLDSKEKVIDLNYDDEQNITIENEIKKGAIKIIKVDADNNHVRIEGSKFEVYNQNKELVGVVITDKNGEAIIDKLPINEVYTVKEIETAKDYILSEDECTVELKEEQIKTLTFKNKRKEAEKLPRTGGIDVGNLTVGFSLVGFVINRLFLQKEE